MLKQDMECLTNQSLIYARPEEGTEQKDKLDAGWGTTQRQSVPECPTMGTVNSFAQGKLPLEFTSPQSSQQGCWVIALQACLLPQKHFSCKSFLLWKVQGAFQICGESKCTNVLSSIIVPVLHSLIGGTAFHTSMILKNPGQSQK